MIKINNLKHYKRSAKFKIISIQYLKNYLFNKMSFTFYTFNLKKIEDITFGKTC